MCDARSPARACRPCSRSSVISRAFPRRGTSPGPAHDPGATAADPEDKGAARASSGCACWVSGARGTGFDAFADRSPSAAAPYAMVNFVGEHRSFFAGLHQPGDRPLVAVASPKRTARTRNRSVTSAASTASVRMSWSGARRSCSRTSATTPLRLQPGRGRTRRRSYMGAALVDRTGLALGTVCAIDLEPRPWEGRDWRHQGARHGTGPSGSSRNGPAPAETGREGKLRPSLRNPRWTGRRRYGRFLSDLISPPGRAPSACRSGIAPTGAVALKALVKDKAEPGLWLTDVRSRRSAR